MNKLIIIYAEQQNKLSRKRRFFFQIFLFNIWSNLFFFIQEIGTSIVTQSTSKVFKNILFLRFLLTRIRPQDIIDVQHDLSRKFELLKAIEHIKLHDPKLGAHLTEEMIADFQLRLDRADGANPFRSLVRAIVYQQIHGKAASSIYTRFLKLFDKESEDLFPTPLEVLEKSVEELRSAGLSTRKVYINSDVLLPFSCLNFHF